MKKNIAIMVCHKVTHICAGGGCFDAFQDRKKAFSKYKDQDVCIKGFFHCGGCGCDRESKDFLTK